MSRRRGFSKKRRFCRFFVSPSKKNSTGCHSDNFDPRTSAYGSFESLCPKFSETHVEMVSIIKIVGASPLRSQVILAPNWERQPFGTIFHCCPKKISIGCQSDNFYPRRSAHGSSESLYPKFSETHVKMVSIFKILGASPLRSQVILAPNWERRPFGTIFHCHLKKFQLAANRTILILECQPTAHLKA